MVEFFGLAILKKHDLDDLIDSNVNLTLDCADLRKELVEKSKQLEIYKAEAERAVEDLVELRDKYKEAYDNNYNLEERNERQADIIRGFEATNKQLTEACDGYVAHIADLEHTIEMLKAKLYHRKRPAKPSDNAEQV